MKMKLLITMIAFVISVPAFGNTLDNIKKKGFIQCGVSQGLPGFSSPDKQGNWQGLDVDFCRALAAATLGDANKVKYTPLSAKERFTALQSGEIDILSRNTTWTLVRDTALGLDFAGVTYYDGQAFMFRKDLGVKSVNELDGATVCVNQGTTTELNVADYFRQHKMTYTLLTFDKADETVAAYDAGRCDVYTTSHALLMGNRLKLKKPSEHTTLPEIISKEPTGPVVRQGDDQWCDIARWTLYALLEAEELGINKSNVVSHLQSVNPTIKRLLGQKGNLGQDLGLGKDWALNVIKQVGNYGEIFDRNLGPGTPLNIARGLNALWNKGGLQYSMPFR